MILSLYDVVYAWMRAREAGAAAFVAKYRAEDVLLATIRRMARELA